MENEFPTDDFKTSEELLRELQERSDDFEGLTLMVVNDLPLSAPSGQKRIASDCCGIIKLSNGESLLIHREELQTLLNDGILTRMGIPITLLPQTNRDQRK